MAAAAEAAAPHGAEMEAAPPSPPPSQPGTLAQAAFSQQEHERHKECQHLPSSVSVTTLERADLTADTSRLLADQLGAPLLDAVLGAGCNGVIVGLGSTESLWGEHFAGLYDVSPAEEGIVPRLVREVFRRLATVSDRYSVSISCLRLGGSGGRASPVASPQLHYDLLGGGSSVTLDTDGGEGLPPCGGLAVAVASPDAAVQALEGAMHQGSRCATGHTVVFVQTRHQPRGAASQYTVEGNLHVLDLLGDTDDVHVLTGHIQGLVEQQRGAPGPVTDPLWLLLRSALAGRSACQVLATAPDPIVLELCTSLRQLAQARRIKPRPNALSCVGSGLMRLLQQQQRSHDTLKRELEKVEIRAAKAHERFGEGGSGLPMDLSGELTAMVQQLPEGDGMPHLRALCALVPVAKSQFIALGGMAVLTGLADSQRHSISTAYQAVYTIAALCESKEAALAALRAGCLRQLRQLLAACEDDHVKEGAAMAVDRLCDAPAIAQEPELGDLVSAFDAILRSTENQQVQYRYAAALARLFEAAGVVRGCDGARLLGKAAELLTSPVREVQVAATELVIALLGSWDPHGEPVHVSLAVRILQRMLATVGDDEQSLQRLSLASNCAARLVEIPEVCHKVVAGRQAPIREKCIECVARAACIPSLHAARTLADRALVISDHELFHSGYITLGQFDAYSSGGLQSSPDFRSAPQYRLKLAAASAVTFCLTALEGDGGAEVEEDEGKGRMSKVFLGLDVFVCNELGATGRTMQLQEHVGGAKTLTNFTQLITVQLPSAGTYVVVVYTDSCRHRLSFSLSAFSHTEPCRMCPAEPEWPVYYHRCICRVQEGLLSSGGGLGKIEGRWMAGCQPTWRNTLQHVIDVPKGVTADIFISVYRPNLPASAEKRDGRRFLVTLVKTCCSRRHVGSFSDDAVATSSICSREATLSCQLSGPGSYALLYVDNRPTEPCELLYTLFSSAQGISWRSTDGSADGVPEWPLVRTFECHPALRVLPNGGLGAGGAEALFNFPQLLVEHETADKRQPAADVHVVMSCSDPAAHVGLCIVRDSGRKKQVLARFARTDSWIWNDGAMQRSETFAPLEATLTLSPPLLPSETLLICPTVFECSVELDGVTLSVFATDSRLTVCPLLDDSSPEDTKLIPSREPLLLSDAQHIELHVQPAPVPLGAIQTLTTAPPKILAPVQQKWPSAESQPPHTVAQTTGATSPPPPAPLASISSANEHAVALRAAAVREARVEARVAELSAALQVAAADHAAELAAQEQRGQQQLQATLEAEQQAHATRTEGLQRAVAELTEEAAAHQLAVSRLRGEPEALSGCSLQEVRALPRFRHIA
jgi:hypothetical protein